MALDFIWSGQSEQRSVNYRWRKRVSLHQRSLSIIGFARRSLAHLLPLDEAAVAEVVVEGERLDVLLQACNTPQAELTLRDRLLPFLYLHSQNLYVCSLTNTPSHQKVK